MNSQPLKKALDCLKIIPSEIDIDSKALYMESDGDNMTLRCFSDNSSGKVIIPCDLELEQCVIDIDLFYKVIKSVGVEVILDLKDGKDNSKILTVESGGSKFKLICFEKKINNKLPDFLEEVDFNPKSTYDLLRKASVFSDPTSSFIQLRSVYSIDDLSFTASPFRITVLNKNPFKEKISYSPKLVDFLSKIDGTSKISLNSNFLRVKNDNLEFIFSINKDGSIPAINKYLTMKSDCSDKLDVELLNQILNKFSVFNPTEILFSSDGVGKVKISGTDMLKTSLDSIFDSKFNKKFTIKLDFAKFKESLKIFDEGVKFEIFEPPDMIRLSEGEVVQILSTIVDE